MDFSDPYQRRVFFDLHSELPREGPGDQPSTAKALAFAQQVSPCSQVLDIGCGPGQQTMDLAALLPKSRITAVDLHQPFLAELLRRAHTARCDDRVATICGDMAALPFPNATFDLLWCEGAAYFLGLPKALDLWKPLLKPRGVIALTEAVWLRPDPPEDLQRFWSEYPAMTDMSGCRKIITESGYNLVSDFVLPDQAWVTDYYDPMSGRLAQLAPKYANDPLGTALLQEHREEIAMFQRYSAFYGYVFLIMTPIGD